MRELTPKEVIEIYEVREILEVAAALRTPLPAPTEIIKVLKKIQDEPIANHDLRKVFRLNIQFHHQQCFQQVKTRSWSKASWNMRDKLTLFARERFYRGLTQLGKCSDWRVRPWRALRSGLPLRIL